MQDFNVLQFNPRNIKFIESLRRCDVFDDTPFDYSRYYSDSTISALRNLRSILSQTDHWEMIPRYNRRSSRMGDVVLSIDMGEFQMSITIDSKGNMNIASIPYKHD